MSLHQAGLSQAVASLGTAVTAEQARLIKRYCESCFLAYDADSAGQAATERGIEIFESAGLAVRVVTMQAGDDPDSLIRRAGVEAFRERLQAAQGIVEYRMDVLSARLDLATPEGRSFLPAGDDVHAEEHSRHGPPGSLHPHARREDRRAGGSSEIPGESASPGLLLCPVPRVRGTTPKRKPWERALPGQERRPSPGGDPATRERDGAASRARPAGPPSPPSDSYGPRQDLLNPGDPSGSTVPISDRVAERNLLRYLLKQPDVLSQARECVTADQIADPALRVILESLYAMIDRLDHLTPQDISSLASQEGLTKP